MVNSPNAQGVERHWQLSPRQNQSASFTKTAAGTLLLFVTFSQGNVTSASQFVILYLPILSLALVIIGGRRGSASTLAPSSPARLGLLLILVPVLLATLSTATVQYVIILLGFTLIVLTLPVGGFLQNLPTYAYYAAWLNAMLYMGEVIFWGQLGIPFDPSVFNYIGVDREGIITTWGLTRYGGHHSEPGSFAVNFAALTVLSLMGDRMPTLFHWFAVFLLAGTLSITAALLAVVVVVSIILTSRLTARSLLLLVLGLGLIPVLILQVLPLLGLQSMEFLTERLVDRGGNDISIYIKAQLIEDVKTRDFLSTILGNRYAECFHCSYSKSMGFGFYFLFQGGLVGAIAVATIGGIAIWRLGRKGFALFIVFMLMRLEFHFPQAMMLYLIVAGLPAPNGRSSKGKVA
ncbi:hypothetical protein [Ruegeria atlantica]|uniref:hypothetical protein n=1 Tax=Ruegeria atlantica TaxID=81569 RepID=UPI001479AC9D|nr:hypothetical protein [Ruegeria atlantica]